MIYILGTDQSIFIQDYLREIGKHVPLQLLNTNPIKGCEITKAMRFTPEWWWKKYKASSIKSKLRYVWLIGFGLSLNDKDVIHSHFLSGLAEVLIFFGARLRGAKCIITFWGSDLFVPERRLILLFRRVAVYLASFVTLSTSEMNGFFKNKYKIVKKISIARFALPNLEFLKVSEEKEFHQNRNIVIKIGYNAKPQQQHIPVLDAISVIGDKNDIEFEVHLPLGYGRTDLNYLDGLKSHCTKLSYQTNLIEDFLSSDQLIESIRNTDIFINVQETDAQSATMQEHMYAGSVVIAGAWLPYDELLNSGCQFYRVSSIEEIRNILPDIVANLKKEKEIVRVNQNIIDKISSWSAVKGQWLRFYSEGGNATRV